jgi:hypothetical protein
VGGTKKAAMYIYLTEILKKVTAFVLQNGKFPPDELRHIKNATRLSKPYPWMSFHQWE